MLAVCEKMSSRVNGIFQLIMAGPRSYLCSHDQGGSESVAEGLVKRVPSASSLDDRGDSQMEVQERTLCMGI